MRPSRQKETIVREETLGRDIFTQDTLLSGIDREARVLRARVSATRLISRGTAFPGASADTHIVRPTPMSCLDKLAVRGTLLLQSFGRVGAGQS